MQARQTILPKRLVEPGPDAGQLKCILKAAASAPDHRQLLPWLLWGQVTQVGKNTVKGNGWYEVA